MSVSPACSLIFICPSSSQPCPYQTLIPHPLAASPPLTPQLHARIHPNLRSTIYCNAIAQGGHEEWDFAWSQLQQAELVNEADKLRSALACTNHVWLLNR